MPFLYHCAWDSNRIYPCFFFKSWTKYTDSALVVPYTNIKQGFLQDIQNCIGNQIVWCCCCFPFIVVVVYHCSISNVMHTGDIEALFVLVHAVLDCQKHTRCFVEPFQLLPHPGLDWQVHTHYGIPQINAPLLPISRQAYGECAGGP